MLYTWNYYDTVSQLQLKNFFNIDINQEALGFPAGVSGK